MGATLGGMAKAVTRSAHPPPHPFLGDSSGTLAKQLRANATWTPAVVAWRGGGGKRQRRPQHCLVGVPWPTHRSPPDTRPQSPHCSTPSLIRRYRARVASPRPDVRRERDRATQELPGRPHPGRAANRADPPPQQEPAEGGGGADGRTARGLGDNRSREPIHGAGDR